MVDAKPLFIPLKAEWFNAFADGSKSVEYRAYGPRWNEETCWLGRDAILAYGYGWPRLRTFVTTLNVLTRDRSPEAARIIYPKAARILAIGLAAPASIPRPTKAGG